MRRILLIVLLVALVIGGFFAYKKYKTNTTPSGAGTFFPQSSQVTPSTVPSGSSDIAGQLSESTPTVTTVGQDQPQFDFKKISAEPIAGYVSYYIPVTQTTLQDPKNPKSKQITQTTQKHLIRYVSKKTGYVYEVADGELPLQISNIYIPNVYEASFADDNNTAILRFLRDDQQTIATYAVPIPPQNKDGSRTQQPGVFFSDNILSLVVAPDQKSVVGLTYGALGSIKKMTTTGTKPVELFASPLKELTLFWPSKDHIFVQTKPSYNTPGFLYEILDAKRLHRIVGDTPGLTTSLSPKGGYLLYSESATPGFATKLVNIKTGKTTTLSFKVLPEKCTWLENEDLLCAGNTFVAQGNYPDDWYMGVVHFNDALYHLYTQSAVYDVIHDTADTAFDMTVLSVDTKSASLYFIDKNTGYLWSTSY